VRAKMSARERAKPERGRAETNMKTTQCKSARQCEITRERTRKIDSA